MQLVLPFLFHQKSLGTGMGGQSVEDLERVIAAMRRVVERLQGENDQLKKTVGAGGPQYGEVLKENKRLKVRRSLLLFLLFVVLRLLQMPFKCQFASQTEETEEALCRYSEQNYILMITFFCLQKTGN